LPPSYKRRYGGERRVSFGRTALLRRPGSFLS
jgi:hypothetical protein